MATNRFICEVCNKGFQREQNLQLHRRGHNLPWKLKQKTNKEVKRKVYLCPEPTCVHHDPSRALGDLTGIKKHYSRKHGEKKWKCEKCSKRYAVQSDWKAHSKTCGTREYRCDCGTLFSRRDSFITHRAFCDALAQETARQPPSLNSIGNHLYGNRTQISSIQQDQSNQTSTGDILRLGGGGARSTQFDHLLSSTIGSSSSSFRPQQPMVSSSAAFFNMPDQSTNQNFNQEHHHQSQQGLLGNTKSFQGLLQFQADMQNNSTNPPSSAANLFNLSFNNSNNANTDTNLTSSGLLISDHFNNENTGGGATEASSLFSNNINPSLFSSSVQNNNMIPQMSATALLQKAAQMGSTSSNNNNSTASLLKSFGSSSSTGTNLQELMNSIASGNSTIFGSGGLNTQQQQQQNLNVSIGGSDRLTRDFLGVGQIIRSMSGGGVSQREQQQQQQHQLGSDRNTNMTAPTSYQSFGGGAGDFQ
ncbi:hypothetical protein PTKIN_Ptkin17bG0121400 [Pterospermum kingtungense]